MRHQQRLLAGLGILAASVMIPVQPAMAAPELVIIIDDVGNNRALGERTVNLPGPVTLAFLPFTPFAESLAEKAWAQGKGIMLHAPMANETGAALGPGALTEEMTQEEIHQTLSASLDSIPHVQGINNHMGSRLTQSQDHMNWVMDTVSHRGLYFIDSLTNPASVAKSTAAEEGILTAKRDVFLDNDRDLEGLTHQFQRALTIAKRSGSAILIGHPYPETLDFLETVLPVLAETGEVELVRADYYLVREAWVNGTAQSEVSRLQLRLPKELSSEPAPDNDQAKN